MPNNDPHTAGPAQLAHRIGTGKTFDVSVTLLKVAKADRMSHEVLETIKRRMIVGHSRAYNFGRMSRDSVKSSGKSIGLVLEVARQSGAGPPQPV